LKKTVLEGTQYLPGLVVGVHWSCRNSSRTDFMILIYLIEDFCLHHVITSLFPFYNDQKWKNQRS